MVADLADHEFLNNCFGSVFRRIHLQETSSMLDALAVNMATRARYIGSFVDCTRAIHNQSLIDALRTCSMKRSRMPLGIVVATVSVWEPTGNQTLTCTRIDKCTYWMRLAESCERKASSIPYLPSQSRRSAQMCSLPLERKGRNPS